jgi:salicylate hydroxylase
MPRWSIAVAGAGTGGLAAAAFLKRAGHDVTLFERFSQPKPLGAGLMIQPTGLACLAALGVDDAALELGRTITGIRGDTVQGHTIFDISYRDLGDNLTALAMHRAALFHVLALAAERAQVSITGDTEIASSLLENDKRVLIDTRGNRHGPFDLVVDGTGMRSKLRAAEGDIRLNRPYPYGAVWAALRMTDAWHERDRLLQRYDRAHTMVGILPIGRRPDETHERAAFFWSLPVADFEAWRSGTLATWKTRVATVWPTVQPFLEQIKSHDDLTRAQYADVWLKQPHTKRLVFIGDAARSASPQLGQGANLALIDALILTRVLATHTTVQQALDAFATARRAHTRFYGLASRTLTPFFQSDSRIAAAVRDVTFQPMARIPYVRREMVRTLAGMKTGLFTSLNPGDLYSTNMRDAAPKTARIAGETTP